MKSVIFCIIFSVFSITALAEETIVKPQVAEGTINSVIIVYGAADPSAILPVFEDFQKNNPSITIDYTEFSTVELYNYFLNEPDKRPDLLLSPAMDLQIKLVNDGYALAYKSEHTDGIPSWAQWRNEVFGFTYEPVVIVLNKSILQGDEVPQSRTQLVNFIRKKSLKHCRQSKSHLLKRLVA